MGFPCSATAAFQSHTEVTICRPSSSIHSIALQRLNRKNPKTPFRGKPFSCSASMTHTAKGSAKTLYRGILRAHKRYLPQEMKGLGDSYVKSEFNMFKKVTDDDQLKQFFSEWNHYLDQLMQTARRKESISAGSLESSTDTAFGKHLSADVSLTDEQMSQLQKLREETERAGAPD